MKPPIPTAKWEDADVYAVQALGRGEATPEQQQRALKWIIEDACLTYDFSLSPDSDRLSAIFDGRRFAGLSVVKLLKISMSQLKQREKK